MSEQRLQKVMARAGVASRRKSEELIVQGRVTVNGQVAELGQKVGPDADIRVDGRPVERRERHRTFALNKPPGYLTTAEDDRGRPTVMDLVPAAPGLHPVGRLDLDSEGLLLLTTDGQLTLQLTHPRYLHEKEYRVWCAEGTVPSGLAERLEQGVSLEDGPARAVTARPRSGGIAIVLHEGRNRQVRRMIDAVGYSVERLLRTRIAGLRLGDLAPGAYRELGQVDLELLELTHTGAGER